MLKCPCSVRLKVTSVFSILFGPYCTNAWNVDYASEQQSAGFPVHGWGNRGHWAQPEMLGNCWRNGVWIPGSRSLNDAAKGAAADAVILSGCGVFRRSKIVNILSRKDNRNLIITYDWLFWRCENPESSILWDTTLLFWLFLWVCDSETCLEYYILYSQTILSIRNPNISTSKTLISYWFLIDYLLISYWFLIDSNQWLNQYIFYWS